METVRTVAGDFARIEREIIRPAFPAPVVVVWEWGRRTFRSGQWIPSEEQRREIRRAAEAIERTERIRYF